MCVYVPIIKDNKLVMSFTCCYSSASISAFNRILGYPLFAMRSWGKKDHDNTKDGHEPIRFVYCEREQVAKLTQTAKRNELRGKDELIVQVSEMCAHSTMRSNTMQPHPTLL